jgi:hypothetical protein
MGDPGSNGQGAGEGGEVDEGIVAFEFGGQIQDVADSGR